MNNLTIGFIGLGLIGGSIAKSFKAKYPDIKIMAYSRSKNTLDKAFEDKTIDIILDDIDERLGGCDYIFLCTPVSLNEMFLEKLRPFLHENSIVTDVGSVKGNIHRRVEALGLEAHFIGGHPMAGSEKSGYDNSNGHLLENAYYVITPTDASPKARVDELIALVKSTGAIPLVTDYNTHDYIVAGISHLPHVIAASLVKLVKDKDTPSKLMKQIAAGGFKDITRIASSSPDMWQQICLENKDNLSAILDDYIDALNSINDEIKAGSHDAVYNLFEESGEYRNSLPDKSSGPIKKRHAIYCDIIDKAGAIATIATILAVHQINIKNIGIIHNREFEKGVLSIEFEDEESSLNAAEFLRKFQYNVYVR
ncbi:MAG: prephenate dehydrogenase [Lachnospiraceae bacterium]|nr:prephenate dehydrogenase [Lachnospiraceae bacterium]